MEKRSCLKGVIREVLPFILVAFLLSVSFQSCQKEELTKQSNAILKSAIATTESVNLIYPENDINSGEDFDITFSSTCGKIMVERGYVNGDLTGADEFGNPIYEKVYAGLTCDAENLQWEYIGIDVFTSCGGKTITENWSEVGTYVYRAKWNQTKVKTSECQNCQSFKGNQYECFMVTVVEANFGTFTDARDSKEYKWVKIGDQVWMAENLAYLPSVNDLYENSYTVPYYYVYDYSGLNLTTAVAKTKANYSTYGVLYNWSAAQVACPSGWHLPGEAEWILLENYLIANGNNYDGTTSGNKLAKALAAVINWNSGSSTGTPGYQPELNNRSGFGGLPGGIKSEGGSGYIFKNISLTCNWWTSTPSGSNDLQGHSRVWTQQINWDEKNSWRRNGSTFFDAFYIRCVKD